LQTGKIKNTTEILKNHNFNGFLDMSCKFTLQCFEKFQNFITLFRCPASGPTVQFFDEKINQAVVKVQIPQMFF
jgi:hypothetical protein